jgi:hypothetical protein
MAQFSDVSSIYGAPMGRYEYGVAENCEPNSIAVFKVNLDSGGYDDGGAYFGTPDNLYCAQDDDGRYIHFVRAGSPSEAIAKLQIDPEYLAEHDYAAEAQRVMAIAFLEDALYSEIQNVTPEDFPGYPPEAIAKFNIGSVPLDPLAYLDTDQLEHHIPWAYTEQAITRISQRWQGKYSVAKLYEEWGATAVRRLANSYVGGGLCPTDDSDVYDQFKELGIDCHGFYGESPDVWDVVVAIVQGWMEEYGVSLELTD